MGRAQLNPGMGCVLEQGTPLRQTAPRPSVMKFSLLKNEMIIESEVLKIPPKTLSVVPAQLVQQLLLLRDSGKYLTYLCLGLLVPWGEFFHAICVSSSTGERLSVLETEFCLVGKKETDYVPIFHLS